MGKPNPSALDIILSQSQLKKEDCLMIGIFFLIIGDNL